MLSLTPYLYIDAISIVLAALILFVGVNVGRFAWSSLAGDTRRGHFLVGLALLLLAALVLVSADHLLLLVGAWGVCNLLLAQLMIHKAEWRAARQSGRLFLTTTTLGTAALAVAAWLLWHSSGSATLSGALAHTYSEHQLMLLCGLIIFAALCQSALWPMHRWLTSSLNAPTPVSSLMHAGLINAGGLVLIRFADLFAQLPVALLVLFALGLVSALLGSWWKLCQTDVKRLLACSTLAQMGFMVLQCGLGLFGAALAHLVWHGLFKAYLFLGAGSAAQTEKQPQPVPTLGTLTLAMLLALGGAAVFALVTQTPLTSADTRWWLVALCWLTATQIALWCLQQRPLWSALPAALLTVLVLAGLYGLSVHGFEQLLPELSQPQPLHPLHLLGFGLLAGGWLVLVLGRPLLLQASPPAWLLRLYVAALNGSQPHPHTITAHRNHYRA